jgi:chromosome segregation ATPase
MITTQPLAAPLLNHRPAASASNRMTLMDACFGVGHVAAVGAAVGGVLVGASYVAIAAGVAELTIIAGHVYYRKYGILGRDIAVLNAAGERLDGTVRREADVENGLRVTVEGLRKTVEDLTAENVRLKGLVDEEKKNNDELAAELKEYKDNNALLEKNTADLEAGTKRIAGLIPEMSAGAARFAAEDEKAADSTSKLQKVVTAIARAVGLLGTFESQFKQNQSAMDAQVKQNQALQVQMSALQAKMDSAEQETKKVLQELTAAKDKLAAENVALRAELAALPADIATLSRTREALSADEHTLTDSLAAFQAGAAADAKALEEGNAALRELLKNQSQGNK